MKTKLNSLEIKNFRALSDIKIELGEVLTAICGKNGTSKSSILGIAAQVFSFEKDFRSDEDLNFKTITGDDFTSRPSDHFRLSDDYDKPGSMDVTFNLYDGYTSQDLSAKLVLMKRGEKTRPQVRDNTSIPEIENTSRKFTHPVIFLSLKRLMPIPARGKYNKTDYEYLLENKKKFVSLSNELLNKRSDKSTATDGSIKSATAHGNNYDHNSVSTGEDNAGQIVLALMSFKKLKEEYGDDYKGGLLLIDEADAGLFPAAQVQLIDMLAREAKDLNIQIIITTHSPSIIEHTHHLSQKYRRKFKTIYLSDTYGTIQSHEDKSWIDIYADLSTSTIKINNEINIPKINLYFEDKEAQDFFDAIFYRSRVKSQLNILKEVSLGCTNYIDLVKRKIPEFSKHSIIILDGDVENTELLKSIILLPSNLAPDQLIFEYLYNLPADDQFWKNDIKFTKHVFDRVGREITNRLEVHGDGVIDLAALIENIRLESQNAKPLLRTLFKSFYNSTEITQALASRKNIHHPWRSWLARNPESHKSFMEKFKEQHIHTLVSGWGVERHKAELIWGE